MTNIQYAAHGALASENYGTLLHTISYDDKRLQPTSIKLLKSTDATVVPLDLRYTYGAGTTNNGNIASASMRVQNIVGTVDEWTQSFTYDALNRLDIAKEVKGGWQQWQQNFDYDQYGNRCLRTVANPPCAPDVNAATNRLNTAGTGYSYDLAGNLTSMPRGEQTLQVTYDAENHIKSVGADAAYVYDGEGQRVRKLLG
ncbi:MAG TPA: hypothetical protein VFQ47_04040, partial [Nitrososphaera sp.]|nr:hypothetical protein [Nitrososphaera sp.]